MSARSRKSEVGVSVAQLVGGKVPSGQIPSLSWVRSHAVANQAAMLALTGVAAGEDLALRQDGAGTFLLTGADPSQLASWTLLPSPTDAVVSVNGRTGAVVLAAADVGADASGAAATVQGNLTTHTSNTSNPHATTAAQTGAPNVVVHGATAGTARPAGATLVLWIGSVAPTNAATNDWWWDTSVELSKRWSGTAWKASGSAAYTAVSTFKKQAAKMSPAPPLVMTAPPTVTKGASGGASTIASSVLVQSVTAANWSVRGGSSATKSVRFGGTPTYYDNHPVTSTLDQNTPWLHDTMFYGQKFEVQIAATSAAGWLQVWVNDQPIAATVISQTDNDGTGYKYLVDFGTADTRRITIGIGGIAFGGIYIGPTDSVWPVAKPRRTRALFLGDSFTAGSNTTKTAYAYPFVVGQELGWDDIWFSGESGTGYLAAGSGGGRTTFRGRVSTDIAPYAPDVVVVYGGTNDTGSTPANVQAEAQLLYAAILAALPNVDLYVVGVQYPSGAADATRDAIDAALQAAVTATPGVKGYISAKTWFTGTGRVGATTGSGNSDIFTSSDALHPTDAGHGYIGRRIAQGITALL
jgi:lysophospholipase L1-like esterase